MSSSEWKENKVSVKPVSRSVPVDNKSADTKHEVSNTAHIENLEIHTPAPREPGSKPTSSVDAYNLLKDGAEPVTIGDFSVSKKLGQGGMGAVFRAKQISLDREVALKVLARHLVDDEKFVSRFQREARVMARLDHQNIIRCHSVGNENGLWYLAMEYVDGYTLLDLIDKHGKLPVGDALYITLCVADALNYAHELNLVHRDIKPDNVLINKKGVVKLADLGLAKPMNDDLSMTASGVGAGTPTYMAPEQMRSAKDVDGRADIYALGGMLYVMLTGKKPHDGATLVTLLEQKEKGRIESARKLNPKVPDKLDLMIEKMLARSLTARYQTCAELIHDLSGLGLANHYISVMFPDGPPGGSGHISKSMKPVPRNTTPISVAAEQSTAAKTPTPSSPTEKEAGTPGIWYLAVGTTSEGKKKVRKLSEKQLKELIKSKQVSSTAEASKQAGSGYRALATFREFEMLFRSLVAQKKMERKTEKLQEKFAEIAAEVETYERRKWWGRFFNSVGGWVGFILGLVVLAAIGYGLYYVVPIIVDFIAKKLGAS